MMWRRHLSGPWVAETVLCVLGFVASLVPALVYTYPFWGVRAFVSNEPFSNDTPGVIVTQIDADSPMESAGMRPHDRVVRFKDKPVQFGNFREVLSKVESGEPISIDVKRDGKDVRLEYVGETPKLEAVLFFDWQFVTAPAFLVLVLLLVAAQPLTPAPMWRALIVTLVGLGIVAATAVIEVMQRPQWSWVWQSKAIDRTPSPALHLSLAAIVLLTGLALSLLGALGIRAVLLRREAARTLGAGE